MLSILGDKIERKEAAGTLDDPICLDERVVKGYPLPKESSANNTLTHASNAKVEVSTKKGTWGPSTGREMTRTIPFAPKFTIFLGSPLGLFLTLRCAREAFDDMRLVEEGKGTLTTDVKNGLNVQPSSPFCLPSDAVYNIFHPSDPVAYRIESLLLPPDLDDSEIPKPCYLKLDGQRTRLNTQAQELGDALTKTVENFTGLFQSTRSISDIFPTGKKSDDNSTDAANNSASEKPSTPKRKKKSGPVVHKFALGGVSDRVDFQLQTGVVENEYLSAVSAHGTYWSNDDLLNFVIQCANQEE